MDYQVNGRLRKQDGYYHAVVNITNGTGAVRQRSKSSKLPVAGHNKRRAEDFLRDFMEQVEQELSESAKAFELFLTLYRDWLDNIMPSRVRPNTLYYYRKSFEEYILPYPAFKTAKLRDVTPKMLQGFYNHLLESLAPGTVKKVHGNIHSFFKYAWNMEMINRNPADRVILPRRCKSAAGGAYTEEELALILKVFENDVIYICIFLAIVYGLRRSEVCGLRWENIDFKKKCIHICHTAIRSGGGVDYVDNTKSMTSNRILPLLKPVEEELLKVKSKQEYFQIMLQEEYCNSGYVCTWDKGTPIQPDYLTGHFHEVLQRINEEDNSLNIRILRYHDLRHSAASLLNAKGIPLNNIRAWLGHSDISTTANIYTHSSIEESRKMAAVISDFLTSIET